MILKLFLYKLFFLVSILFVCHNFVFSMSFKKKSVFSNYKNNSHVLLQDNSKKKLFFFNKNECFSFTKTNKIISQKKYGITIFSRNLFGFWKKDRFKIFYIVKKKDTLYSISKNFGHNYYELSQFNFIKKPYKIIVGQKIWIGDFFINENKKNCSIIRVNKKNSISCKNIFDDSLGRKQFLKELKLYQTQKICFSSHKKIQKNNFLIRKKNFVISQKWNWPIKSPHMQYIYHSKSKNKQIEFFGFQGQPVFAAATGRVIFITDKFKKYGPLIILKHNKNYLSIYAFNNLILVKQQDQVYAHQQISTMGLSAQKSARLYFEIRYRGQSINPLDILPEINKKK